MDFLEYLIKTTIALVIVLILIFLIIPRLVPTLYKWRVGASMYEGDNVKIKKIMPISRNTFLVEMYIKGSLVVLCVTEKKAEVIFKEDAGNTSDSTSH